MMKKLFFFGALCVFAALPVRAQQRLGSSGDVTGAGGTYAVFSPQQIQNDDRAGRTVRDNSEAEKQGIHSKRRAQPWVLGGAQAVKSGDEYRAEFDEKQKQAQKDAKEQERLRKLQEKIDAERQAENPSPDDGEDAPADGQDAAVPQSTAAVQSGAVAAQSAAQPVAQGDEIKSGIDGEGTLVCAKYQKCDICPRKKPYWSGKECVSGADNAKAKKAQKSRDAVKSSDSARTDAPAVKGKKTASDKKVAADKKSASSAKAKSAQKSQKNDKKSASKAKTQTASSVKKVGASSSSAVAAQSTAAAARPAEKKTGADAVAEIKDEYGIALYNADGTPKSKKQLYKERQQQRIKAFREKNKKSK